MRPAPLLALWLALLAGSAAAQLANSTAALAAGDVSSALELWTLADNKCKRRCVLTSESPLSWCSKQVTYYSFCNRTADGDADWSVARMEAAAQEAYNALEFGLATTPSPACKVALHRWVCWQFFTQCASDRTTLRPVCATSCKMLADTCVIGWLDCDVEVEEHRRTAPPWWFDASGAYIRGVKPANSSVPLEQRRALTLDTGGVLGQGRLYGALGEPCTAGAGGLAPATAALLLAVAHAATALWTA